MSLGAKLLRLGAATLIALALPLTAAAQGIETQVLPAPRGEGEPVLVPMMPEGLGENLPFVTDGPAFLPPQEPDPNAAPWQPELAAGEEPMMCELRVNGLAHVVSVERASLDETSTREWMRDALGRQISAARGRLALCPSPVILGHLAERYGIGEIEGYCLTADEEGGWLLVPGTQNYRGRCERTACEFVRAQAQEVRDTAGFMAERVQQVMTGNGTPAEERTLGQMIQRRAGAMILSGAGDYVVSNIGSVGSALGSALSNPAVAGGLVVSVVVVGGALYLCH